MKASASSCFGRSPSSLRLERLDARRECLRVVRDHVALGGMADQQVRAPLQGSPPGEAQRACVLGCGLPVRAQPGCARSGRRGELEDRFGVASGLRMMRQPSEVGRPLGCGPESCKRRPVEDEPPVRGDSFLDGEPSQLVTKGHGAVRLHEHSGG